MVLKRSHTLSPLSESLGMIEAAPTSNTPQPQAQASAEEEKEVSKAAARMAAAILGNVI